MPRALILAILFCGVLVNSSWAQDKTGPGASGQSYPGGSEITFEWHYSCESGKDCSFTCMGTGGASHVTKLNIYLGTIPIGNNQNAPAVIYDFSTREIPRANGFSISTGINTLSCQVNGLTEDYAGPPREGRHVIGTTGSTRNNK